MPQASYMLLFRDAGWETHAHLTPEQRAELTAQWNTWYESLASAGKVDHGRPLALARRIVSGPRGGTVHDGPFAETKEAIGGYFILNADDLEEATAIAKNCPGLALGMSVEVRALAERSPVLPGVPARA